MHLFNPLNMLTSNILLMMKQTSKKTRSSLMFLSSLTKKNMLELKMKKATHHLLMKHLM